MKSQVSQTKTVLSSNKRKKLKKYSVLYLMLLPGLLSVFVFSYCTFPGVIIAFKDYNMFRGIFGSDWAGFKHFEDIFTLPEFSGAIWNTMKLSFWNLLFGQTVPLLFALLLNEVKSMKYKRVVQTVSYLPHFLSTMAIIGMSYALFSTYGIINDTRVAMFGEETERVKYLAQQWFFVPNIVGTNIWAGFGWGSIIYLSTIAGIDAEMYEAAEIDGASRFKQCIYITLPCIMPTFVMLFIMAIGNLLRDSFDMVYGLQNAFINYETISTVVYKQGIVAGNYSLSTALGLFQGVIGLVLVLVTNKLSKKINNIGLW
ncbi:MAG: sugar ABC transporter permease [Ruminococcaceae bacterium]|nr:sugar ABC transporter permease [Oscillospiraceae bacterium]